MQFLKKLIKFLKDIVIGKKAKKEEKKPAKLSKQFLFKKKPLPKAKKALIEKTLEQIDTLLQIYNEFIKKDFFLILLETQSKLQEWKNYISNYIGKGNSLEEISSLSDDLQEISQFYLESEIAINNILIDCKNYQNTLTNAKSLIPSIARQTKIQIQLENVIRNLRKGLEIANINNNEEYKFLDAYLQEHKTRIRSR